MAKKLSDVFSSIKYAKMQAKHDKPHVGGSTDDEEHGAVSELEFDQQVAHAKKRSMTEDEEFSQEQIEEAIDHIITARQIIGQSKSNKGGSHEYMKFLKQLRDKFGKDYSTNVHQSATKLAMEEAEQLDEISKGTLVSYTRKAAIDMASKQGESQRPSTPAKKSAELLNKGTKRFMGIMKATRRLGEESEQLDEISDELAKKVTDKRFAAASNWRSNPKAAVKSSKNFKLNQDRKARLNKNKVASPEEIKYSKDNEELRNYNKKMGYSNESVEVKEADLKDACWKGYEAIGTKNKNGKKVPNCVPVSEAYSATASKETHEGRFQEKDHGKHFTYKKTNDAWAKKHNLPHEIDVHDGVRYGHVKGTVAHVATDENDDGTPKIEKWQLKNHKKWMKESRAVDIVREAFTKSKNKKKDVKNDKDVSGKVEKFEADPELTDTLQKQ